MEYQSISLRQRQQHLETCRQAIAYYNPLMEKRIADLGKQVILGQIKAEDMKYLGRDITRCFIEKSVSESDIPLEKLLLLILFKILTFVPGEWESRAKQAQLQSRRAYVHQTIYTSFIRCPLEELEFNLPFDVVHESSYRLWESLGGERLAEINPFLDEQHTRKNSEFPHFVDLMQGFVAYCSRRLFFDLYPEKNQKEVESELRVCTNNPYTKPRKRVEKLVAIHGEKVLLEIPSRWRELSKSV